MRAARKKMATTGTDGYSCTMDSPARRTSRSSSWDRPTINASVTWPPTRTMPGRVGLFTCCPVNRRRAVRCWDGGLGFGEMEKDCVISHGAAEFLRDRLLDNSDPSMLTLCGKCGLLANRPPRGHTSVSNRHFARTAGTGNM